MESGAALETRLLEAARGLCLSGGLGAISFRGVARAAGVSPGLLGHHFGSLERLLERLVAREAEACERWLSGWRLRFEGVGALAAEDVALLVEALLDDWTGNRRGSAALVAELRVAGVAMPGAGTSGIDFWRALLAGRVRGGLALAPLLAGLVADELPFGLAIGDVPSYRMLRGWGIRQLVSGVTLPDPPALAACLADLAGQARTAESWTGSAEERATRIAAAAADLIEDGAVAQLSHRRVARDADVPASTVQHHFPTVAALLEGGVAMLYRRIRRQEEPGRPGRPTGIARVGRATHGVALAALRDPQLKPYAIDMRWRRGENLQPHLPSLLELPSGPCALAAQAIALAAIGGELAGVAGAGAPLPVRELVREMRASLGHTDVSDSA